MPTKIVNPTEGTAPLDGRITQVDLNQMLSSFDLGADITPKHPQVNVIKKVSFYFTRQQLEALLDSYPDKSSADAMEFSLGIHLPVTNVQCEPATDVSNELSLIISMMDRTTFEPFQSEGDFILVNGYSSFTSADRSLKSFLGMDFCCPNSKPPTGT